MNKLLLVLLLVLLGAALVCASSCAPECRSNADCAPGDYCAETWEMVPAPAGGWRAARYCLSIDAGAAPDAGGDS